MSPSTAGLCVLGVYFGKDARVRGHFSLGASSVLSYVPTACSIVCRVLFVNLATKAIGLSAAPHILALSPVSFSVTHGAVIDPATIVRVDPGVGVTLSFADADATPRSKAEAAETVKTLCQWGSMAFCHVSRLSDGHVEHVERTFHVGNVVQSRVVGEVIHAQASGCLALLPCWTCLQDFLLWRPS